MTCKRRFSVAEIAGSVDGALIQISRDVVEFTLRVADAGGVPVAFTVATEGQPSLTFHFQAGETYIEERLVLDGPLVLNVVSAAGTTVEVILWGA